MGLSDISWEVFSGLPLDEKGFYIMDNGRTEHALIAQQFHRDKLDSLGSLATKIRFISKNEAGSTFLRTLLAHKRAMLYFTQPSTRTFLSFRAALQILGMRIGDVRDAKTSSEFKGESKEDSVRTFSSYFDLIVMRSKEGGLAERMAWVLSNSERPVPIINAGSGKDQHPTQALLDIYTLQRSFENSGGIERKKIVFVGDLARGRTVRSLSSLLTNYDDVKQVFVAPDQLQVLDDVQERLGSKGVDFTLSDNLEGHLSDADAIYMTRIQDEWDSDDVESSLVDISKYSIGTKELDVMKKDSVILHPLPRRGEISPDIDHDPRAMYWRQMRNGMWIRAALIADIFHCEKKILDYYEKNM